MFSVQPVSTNTLIASFQLSSAASLNLGRFQSEAVGNGLITARMKPFENIVKKGENADDQHFS